MTLHVIVSAKLVLLAFYTVSLGMALARRDERLVSFHGLVYKSGVRLAVGIG